MANYYCKTRTNYFSVTDLEKFKQIMASCVGEEERAMNLRDARQK